MEKLNFGCGNDLKEGFINADIQKGVDVSFDFNVFPYPFEDNTFDYVYSRNTLEHVDEPRQVLIELFRICKDGATLDISVPYYNCKGAYSDFEHKHFFNDTCFKGFVEGWKSVKHKRRFEILKLELEPTRVGKYIYPRFLREKLSLFIGGIIMQINIKLRVIK